VASVSTLRSGELAHLAGVSADTLRYYERKRLLPAPPRTQSGYRSYPPEALARVQLIRRAIGLGFSVSELARILKARDTGGVPCKMVRALAAEKLEQIDQQLKDLARFRREFAAVLRQWDKLLAHHGNSQARLLESIADAPVRRRRFPPRNI
jgi:MerR family mercuric resistance operon transcriptional regulator